MTETASDHTELVDCCVQYTWGSYSELLDYMSSGWREYMLVHMPKEWRDYQRGSGPVPSYPASTPFSVNPVYRNPEGDRLRSAETDDGQPPESDPETVRRYLDLTGIQRALLCHGAGLLLPALPTVRITLEAVRAANDWTLDRWSDYDPRFFVSMIVPSQVPEMAAAEILRVGSNERVAAVSLGGNGLSLALGHPVYEPIYEAASHLGLTVIIHAGGEALVDTTSYSAAAGSPGTYSEYHSLLPQAVMTHVASLIGQGIFDRHPDLRVFLAGAGAAWTIPFIWRFDHLLKAHRLEVPWMKVNPSEYFRRFFKIGTYPFDYRASQKQLARYFRTFPGLEDMLCFASGYPRWDSHRAESMAQGIPASWLPKVASKNAQGFFRWPVPLSQIDSGS